MYDVLSKLGLNYNKSGILWGMRIGMGRDCGYCIISLGLVKLRIMRS